MTGRPAQFDESPPRVAWVTCTDAAGHDPDEPVGLAALRAVGVAPDVVVWDDPSVVWDSFDLVLPRSTWDYTDKPEEFGRWMREVAALGTLANSHDALVWSLDKRYLQELAEVGVPVVPTTYFPPGESVGLLSGAVVVKPSVGAGSRGVAVFGDTQHDAAREHGAGLQRDGLVAMVQPALASVAVEGEWPLIFFGGTFSHAAGKRVVLPHPGSFDELFAEEITATHDPEEAQISVAGQAMGVVHDRFGPQTYARVDLVRDDHGDYLVLEVELVEPSLFLVEGGDAAAAALADAVRQRILR